MKKHEPVLERFTRAPGLEHFVRLLMAAVVATVAVSATTVRVSAQWPTECVSLNDIVERHLGNHGNVGIYQRVFGDQAEAACRADHRADVQRTFAWVFDSSQPGSGSTDAAQAPPPSQPPGGWPTTCVYLNDVVEAHLGNDHNVGIYARTFGDRAEAWCQRDHAEDVRGTFAWASPCGLAQAAGPGRASGSPEIHTGMATVGQLAVSNLRLQRLLTVMPWLGCHTYSWLADGVSEPDQQTLNALLLTDSINGDLARTIAASPWFADGVDYSNYHDHEVIAIGYLQELAQKQNGLIEEILSYSWITKGFNYERVIVLKNLNTLASHSITSTVALASASWIKDDIAAYEARALSLLDSIFYFQPTLGAQLLDSTVHAPRWSSSVRMLSDIYDLVLAYEVDKTSDRLHRVVTAPWFGDGLDVRERALINAIGMVHQQDDDLFNRLVSNHYSRSLRLSLPLTGSFNIWVFDDEPIPENPHILNTIAQGLRGAERIIQESLPFNDIVVLMVDDLLSPWDGRSTVYYYDNVIHEDGRLIILSGRTDRIYQMVAGFYFTDRAGPNYPYYEFPDPRARLFDPTWFAYSAPEFMNALTNDWEGSTSLADANNAWETEARSQCASAGLTSIHALSMQTEPLLVTEGEPLRHCADLYGRMLLYRLFDTLGEGRMSSVMREIYLLSAPRDQPMNSEGIVIPSERDIYRLFLKNAPPDLRDEVRHWYHHLHGGPFVHEVSWG